MPLDRGEALGSGDPSQFTDGGFPVVSTFLSCKVTGAPGNAVFAGE